MKYTVKEYAKQHNITEETVRRQIRSGKIEATKKSNKEGYMIEEKIIEEKISNLKKQVTQNEIDYKEIEKKLNDIEEKIDTIRYALAVFSMM